MEATGYSRWFERLLAELGSRCGSAIPRRSKPSGSRFQSDPNISPIKTSTIITSSNSLYRVRDAQPSERCSPSHHVRYRASWRSVSFASYERAVVVDAEVYETNKTTPGSEERGLLKKGFDRADIVRDVRLPDVSGLSQPNGRSSPARSQQGDLTYGSCSTLNRCEKVDNLLE